MIRISELAERADVPVATVRHYLREGLLPEPVKTSRNMAYYPPEFAERIRLIKRLQEQRFMPLRVIRELLDAQPATTSSGCGRSPTPATRSSPGRSARRPSGRPRRRSCGGSRSRSGRCERLAEVGVLTPDEDGYSPTDVRIVEAIARFRAAGWNETTGFGARDVARLMKGLEPVIEDELNLLIERFAALGADRAEAIVEGGASPFPELIGALHAKLLTAELERARARLARASSAKPSARERTRLVAELVARLRDHDRALLRGEPDREPRQRRLAAQAQQPPHRLRSRAATAPPARAGTERVGGSTPWVSSSSETNSRKTTGSPSVTK